MRKLWLWVAAAATVAVLQAQVNVGVIPAGEHGKSLHIAAFGDFGDGSRDQMAIAKAIEKRHHEKRFDFGITLGDNFYRCGVRSVTDPKWDRYWERPYGGLGIPFYASLGNHDYGHPPVICPGRAGSPDAEVAYTQHSKTWRMPARYYSYRAGPVLFVVIDTEGWTNQQLDWIEKTLLASSSDPDIKWRIVYGHHPLISSAVHLNERRISVLRDKLMPIFQATKVDLYICGHDHALEHLRTAGIELIVCGGGGAGLGRQRKPIPASVFNAVQHAFLDIEIEGRKLTVRFLDSKLRSLEHPHLEISKNF